MPVAGVFQPYCCAHINRKYGHQIPLHSTGPVSHVLKRTFSIKTSGKQYVLYSFFPLCHPFVSINIFANQL